MITAALYSSATDEWATPQSLFDRLSAEFGQFILDVCATSQNAKCEKYFTRNTDGLSHSWTKRNWMNPPYGRVIASWVQKADYEAHQGNLTIALLPSRTDTRWFQDYIYRFYEVRFLRGRLKFNDGDMPAPFPSMVVVFAPAAPFRLVPQREVKNAPFPESIRTRAPLVLG